MSHGAFLNFSQAPCPPQGARTATPGGAAPGAATPHPAMSSKETTTMSQATVKAAKPLEKMSAQELLELYNSLAPRPRTARFSTRSQAIAKIREYPAVREAVAEVQDVPPAQEARAAEAKAKVAKKTSRPVAKTAAKKAPTRTHKVPQSGRMMDESVIRVLVDSNPRRKGTDAYSYFTKMMGGPTVEKYLHNFQDRRKARQWLGNTIRDGYVKLIG